MTEKYTRKSFNNPLTTEEKMVIKRLESAINQNKNSYFKQIIKYWDKYVYTFCILVNYLNYGMCSQLFPPALVDLKFLYKTTMAKINYVNSFIWVGYLVGSLFGFLYKYINRQLSFIIHVYIMAVFTVSVPLWSNLWLFYLSGFLQSYGGGVWDSGNAVWVVEMWGENSAPVLHLSQMMFGCGTIIAPLLDKPFLYGDLSNTSDTTTNSTSTTTVQSVITTTLSLDTTEDINYSVDRRSNLKVPFMIAGFITLSIPTIMLVMFIFKRYKTPETQTLTSDNKNETKPTIGDETNKKPIIELSSRTRLVLITIIALSLTVYNCLEVTYFSYGSTYYQYIPIRLSASTAAQLMSIMTATYTAGRGVSAIISSKLKPEIMITYHMIVMAICIAILFFGQNSETLINVGNGIIGFGFSAMWPCYFALTERYIKLNIVITSMFCVLAAVLNLTAPFIIGPLIENHPDVFMYVIIANYCLVLTLFIIIMIIIRRSQNYPVLYTIN